VPDFRWLSRFEQCQEIDHQVTDFSLRDSHLYILGQPGIHFISCLMLPKALISKAHDQLSTETSMFQMHAFSLLRTVCRGRACAACFWTPIRPTDDSLHTGCESQILMPQDMISFEPTLANWAEGLLWPIVDGGNCMPIGKVRHSAILLVEQPR
jgi:hypothetical protein